MTGCKIGKITPKKGGATIRVFEQEESIRVVHKWPWGSVVIEYKDGELDRATQLYMLEACKLRIMLDK